VVVAASVQWIFWDYIRPFTFIIFFADVILAALFRNDWVAIILSEITDGYEAKQALDRSGYRTPIVALTAHAMKEEKTKEADFVGHLTQSLVSEEVVQIILRFSKEPH
jgi:CheY-like chemotaxis protein